MIDWNSMKTAAEMSEERPWNPTQDFDINGNTKPHSPVDHEKAFGRAVKYGLVSGGGTWFIHSLISKLLERKKKRTPEERIKAAKRRLAWSLGVGGAAALYGYGESAFQDSLRGTHFNYKDYKPNGPGDYNIVVAGAGSGAHDPYYKKNYGKLFGKLFGGPKYVMFNPNDEEDMMNFVDRLPKGSRVRIYGHSKGGKPAFDLAQYAAMSGVEVNQLHTVDAVGDPWSEKPESGIKSWTNWVLKRRPNMDPSKLRLVKDALTGGSMDGDLIATIGGTPGRLDYATNRTITNPLFMTHGSSIFGAILGQAAKDK